MDFLIPLILVAVAVFLAWRTNRKDSDRMERLLKDADENRLSDEEIARVQREFEERLGKDISLPDAVTRRDAFLYWHLMRQWFSKLSAIYRYDEAKLKKIKTDWADYMALLHERAAANYLSSVGESGKRDEYEEDVAAAEAQIVTIESAFAVAVGEDAVQALERVNSADIFAFDRSGREPMAPAGSHYFPTSIRPYVEELVPDRASEEDVEPSK